MKDLRIFLVHLNLISEQAEANGKHIFLWFEDLILHLHMGMFGSFHFRKPNAARKVSSLEQRFFDYTEIAKENTSYKLSFSSDDWAVDIKAPITCEIGSEEDVSV